MMEAKAKKILTSTFWSASGWKQGGLANCSAEDFEYAKNKGLMFDPLTITHDECISRLRQIHEHEINQEKVVKAFLHSLTTRKIYLRSALSSWALTHELCVHAYHAKQAEEPMYSSCAYCNNNRLMSDEQYIHYDLNVLQFERVKWGGVRHNNLIYCLMDLEMISKEPELVVTKDDVHILKEMIQAINECDKQDGARGLEKRWKDVFPSNKHERDSVLEIWGYAGLLVAGSDFRKERGRGTDYMSVATWRGEDSYSRKRMEYLFGTYL